MLLSIVTGTHNRLPYLQLMLGSIRRQLHKGIDYEFIIVDGGSTDGTLVWCKQQPDVRLIEQGQLVGAIRAFGAGARAARGQYVLLANDDVLFKPNSILPALVHLETHASCAAVAFADNRTSLVNGTGKDFRTEGIGVTLANGAPSMVTYAQVGLFRRDLAEQAGWWGDLDDTMNKSRTYGGDSYLSARLWEMGYTVDPVEGCIVEDLIVRDALRNTNSVLGRHDGAAYYERFPTVHVPTAHTVYPIKRRMRVLYLPVYEGNYPQAMNREQGMTEALQDIGALVYEVDYLNTSADLPGMVKAWQPDLILTQIQGIGEKLTTATLAAMRAACPSALVVNWNGDAHMDGLVSQPMLDLLRHVDIQTTVNAAALPIYKREGVRAAYWQIGIKFPLTPLPVMPAWDVLYQANWYAYRDPLFDMLAGLRCKVGMYGNHALAVGNTHYDFAAQFALYSGATITVGDTFPFNTYAFVSNRVFQALAAGAFLLQQHSEGLQDYTGLTAGVHYVEWSDVDDLREQIEEWLKPERASERARIAAAGQAFVNAHFSYSAQVRKLLTEIIPACMSGQTELAHEHPEPMEQSAELVATWMD